MSLSLTYWKKYKSSSTFHRKVKQNVTKILLAKKQEDVSYSVPNSVVIQPLTSVPSHGSSYSQQQKTLLDSQKIAATVNIVTSNCPGNPNDTIIDTTISNNSIEDEGSDFDQCNQEYQSETRDNWLLELNENCDDDDDPANILLKQETEEETKNQRMTHDIKEWANNFNIRHRALKEIIRIINNRWPSPILPQDPRTLLETPATIILTKINEGFYWHQGLEYCLKRCHALRKLSSISININIDGLPIYKSSKDEFWPILFNIHELPELQPMVVGIFCGKGKPSDISAYIRPFVEEAKALLLNGVTFNDGSNVKIKIRCFICDSPARAFIKGVANFNGQHGCMKCITVGEYSYITHCNIFPRTGCPKRTNEGFRSKRYGLHHKCYTPLEELPIDMVEDFPVADSLHLIDLGIVKRCLMGWRDGSFKNFGMKWSARDTQNISEFLERCKMPSEIHRAVRGLDCLSHWKGLEFRTFLYYIGIVVLKDYLPYEVYEHFLVLFCGITILSSNYYLQYLDLADALLQHYTEQYREIYGEEYMTSNVHNLSHVVDEVRRLGILSSFSSYPFESKLYQIKNMLRHSRNPLVQAAKRLTELSKIEYETCETPKPLVVLDKQNKGEGINEALLSKMPGSPKFFSKIKYNNYVLTATEMRNKWFLTNQNEIVCLKNLIEQNDVIYVYGCALKNLNNFFETPIESAKLNIYISDCKEKKPMLYTLKDIKCKMVATAYDASTVVFLPLLHTL